MVNSVPSHTRITDLQLPAEVVKMLEVKAFYTVGELVNERDNLAALGIDRATLEKIRLAILERE